MSEETKEDNKTPQEVSKDKTGLYLTVKEVADILRTSEMSVLALVKSEQVESLQFSSTGSKRGRVLIDRSSFVTFIERNSTRASLEFDPDAFVVMKNNKELQEKTDKLFNRLSKNGE